jgi:molybdate/tungstate transport system substrate-binding protein
MKYPMNKSFLLIICSLFIFTQCSNHQKKQELIIFHAGSLSVPFKQIADSFEAVYPNTQVLLEAAGSRACARKVIDLNKPCDILASADYVVIDSLLILDFATWNLKFALNEMCIVYTQNSKRQDEITLQNWHYLLLDPDINYGRSDPETDPCGYRTAMVAQLAEQYYRIPGFADLLLAKDNEHIRPKEVDLLALLETQVVDYIFLYRSVAEQHQLKYLILPDSINLKSEQMTGFYKTASVVLNGKTPYEKTTYRGEPMVYGITQIKNAPSPELAEEFLKFFFVDSVGIKIMGQNGQPSAIPSYCESYNSLPGYLMPFAKK